MFLLPVSQESGLSSKFRTSLWQENKKKAKQIQVRPISLLMNAQLLSIPLAYSLALSPDHFQFSNYGSIIL